MLLSGIKKREAPENVLHLSDTHVPKTSIPLEMLNVILVKVTRQNKLLAGIE